MIWADTTPQHPTPEPGSHGVVARTTYTTAHQMTWKAKVSSYLVTKAVAAGMMAVAALLVLLGHGGERAAVGVAPPVIAGVFLATTGVLLVSDLRRPARFHYLITRGNRRSWLVKGAAVLGAFAAVCAAWFVAGVAGSTGALQVLAAPAALLAAVAAMTRGRYARRFWAGGVVLGLAVPAVVVGVGLATEVGSWPAAAAGISATVGMWFYEDSFVRAGQSVPLS